MITASLVGRHVVANWGATFPPSYGVVADTRVLDARQRQIMIQWDEWDEPEWSNVTDVKEPGETSVNGSPIGVFWVHNA